MTNTNRNHSPRNTPRKPRPAPLCLKCEQRPPLPDELICAVCLKEYETAAAARRAGHSPN